MASPIQSIPNVIKHEILKDLGATDITHLAMVDKLWKGVVDQTITWNRIAQQLNIPIKKGEDPKEKVANYYRYHHVNQSVMQLLEPNRRSEIEAKFKDDFQLNQALPEILEKEVDARKYSDCFAELLKQITQKLPKNGNPISCKKEIDTALFFTKMSLHWGAYQTSIIEMVENSAEFPEKMQIFKQLTRDYLSNFKDLNISLELAENEYRMNLNTSELINHNTSVQISMVMMDLINLGAAYKDYVVAILEAGFIPANDAIQDAIILGTTHKDAEGTLLKLLLKHKPKIDQKRLFEFLKLFPWETFSYPSWMSEGGY